MKAKITAKSELRWPELQRDYTFDILDDDDNVILASQSMTSQPSAARARLEAIVAEYQTAFEDANDIEEGDEI